MSKHKHPSTDTQLGRVVAISLESPLPMMLKTFAERIERRFGKTDTEAAISARLRELRSSEYPEYGVSKVHKSGRTYLYQVLFGRSKEIAEKAGFMDTEEGQLPGKACHTRPPAVPHQWAAEQIIKCRKGQKTKAQVQEELSGMPEAAQTACREAGKYHKTRINQDGYDSWLKWHTDVEEQCNKA